MENAQIIEKMNIDVKETKIDEEILTECLNCRGKDIVPSVENEHEFDGEVEIHNGYMCNNCNCFHFYDGEDLVYEYVYLDGGKERDVEWKINTN